MRSRQLSGLIVVAGCAAIGVTPAMAGCGGDNPRCDAGDGSLDVSSTSDDSGPGMVQVTGTFTSTDCPAVNPIGVGPENGGSVSLSATIGGSPPEGGTFTLSWTASSGTFSNPHSSDTTFLCAAAGTVTVTVTVTVPGASCEQHASTTVSCSKAAVN